MIRFELDDRGPLFWHLQARESDREDGLDTKWETKLWAPEPEPEPVKTEPVPHKDDDIPF